MMTENLAVWEGALALEILAAMLFGALIGLDRRILGRGGGLAENIGAALIGLALGYVYLMAAGDSEGFGLSWLEPVAAIGLFGLGFVGEGARESADPERALDDGDGAVAHLLQAFGLGVACSLGAWTYALVFVILMVVAYVWRTSLYGDVVAQEKAEQAAATFKAPRPRLVEAPVVASLAAVQEIGPKKVELEWFGSSPPPHFAEALLRAAREPDFMPARGTNSRGLPRTKVAHNAARPLDARSAANPQPIVRGRETAEPQKSRIEERGQGPLRS